MDLFGYLKNNLNICLNEQQKEAVESCDKRILLEACPGSGKTTTLVARIAYQILCRHIFPGRILTLTFSRASACDMMDRYKAMFGSFQLPPVHFSTIHSFCYRFLFFCERMGILAVPRLIEKQSHNGKMKILKKIYFEINQEYPIEDQIEELSNQISFVKNKLIQPRGFKSDVHSFASLYDKYESYKKQFNLIDFDDMLLLSYNILNKNPELYKKFGVFHIVNVDEAQDTSLLQHRIIEKLSSDGSLFMVGDTDQSIYSFRGAEPDYIVRIKDIYPETKILRLETNYRSTQKIVRLANGFIHQNKCRHEKNMTTINEEGEKPGVFLLKDIDEQVKMTLQLIRDANCFNDTAVLYRNNLSGLAVAWELVKNGIPFYIRDDYSSFFKHFIVRDIFAFFQMAMDPTDLESFQKIYYKMGTAISNKDIQALKDRANKVDIISELIGMNFHKKHMLRHLSRVRRAFNRISQKDPYIGFEIIENQLQYGDYLKRNPGFLSVFHTLKYFARGTENVTEYKKTLRSLKDCIDQYYSNTWDNGVSLLTLHGSKGLEFDNVILIDLVDGLIPSEKSLEALKMGNRKDYEEEVRLFYVGVTRARKKVFLLSPQTIAGKETVRSRFINQFLWQNKELGEGQIVYHKKFGEGIVMSYNGDVAIIMFKNYGCRKLSVKICLESGLLRVE